MRLAAVATLTVLSLAACGGGQRVQGVKLVRDNVLSTCTHLPYAPFQFQRTGAVVGFDVDLIGLAARRLGVKQRIVDVKFATITSGDAFADGRCDVGAGGMTINAQRTAVLDFSRPYFLASQAMMARKGVRHAVAGVGSGKLRLGVVAGTTGEEYARDHHWTAKAYENSVTELDALRTGQVDVIVQDDPVVRYWLTDPANAGFAEVTDLHTDEKYGFAVRKGHNPELVKLIDQVITQAREDGTYRRLYEKWMGPMPAGALA